MPQGGSPSQMPVGNSNGAWVTGVVDTLDPKNADGSPKTIDNATVTWEIRSQPLGGGVQLASGSATPLGGGVYFCALSSSIALLFNNDYYFRLTLDTPTGFRVLLERLFNASSRTGGTPYT